MKKTNFTNNKPQELLLSDDSFDDEEIEEGLIKDSVLQLASDRYDDFDPDEFSGSKLRNINAPQINLESEYGGVSVSRKKLASDDEDVGTSDDDDGQSVDVNENGDDDVKDDQGSVSEEMGSGASEQEDEEDEFSDEYMSNDDEKPKKNKQKGQTDENENSCSIYSKKSLEVHEDIEKGNAIRQQYEIWENLLECRIKLQKCLSASNKLPQNDNFSQIVSKLPKPEQNKISKTVRNLCGTLRTLVDLQTVLMNSQPEFSSSSKSRELIEDDDDNASISSSIASGFDDDDDDGDAKSENVEGDEEPPPKKLRQVGDFGRVLSSQHSVYLPARNAAIQKWNDKTRVAAGKAAASRSDNFAAFDQSTLKQIEQIMCDKQRLIKRTQTKRSVYSALEPDRDVQENGVEKKVLAECDVEIFDDDDFYHKLLRDLIDQRSSDITDSSKMGRQWVELQKARSKMKRNVDVKSTKGRRLRYTVHQKLVNFMAPIPYNSYTDEAESELFNSLFGKLKQ
ncbi:hypothetical protein LSTR_LSTR010342 [Laodelphax striatellus]|uniref:Apoptosis-antagonizing transcription factor C-terminal domain-containing protein n=1 Tax=Laodelphax striatellus TaxID=195883 RepID=A0A482X0H5_LAOST|nr:hypothetical protein LSTR_LSTR010342 [Laodelphax striatellus]